MYNETLQQEILRKHEALNTVDSIVPYCENCESTKRDKEMLHASTSSATGAAVQVNKDLSSTEAEPINVTYQMHARHVDIYTAEEKQCPAADNFTK